MDAVLIGTFIRGNMVPRKVMRDIFETFNVKKIFIFEVKEDSNKRSFLLTYNIDKKYKDKHLRDFKNKFRNTVQLHRKKNFNILYTINSLNAIVVKQNGKQDSNYDVDWSLYKNACLLSDKENNLKVLKTNLYDVVEF